MKEFLKWLEENSERLKTYSVAEIVDLAVACGHDRAAIARWATSERFRNVA